jgi:alpha-1,2-mannosyltransferase
MADCDPACIETRTSFRIAAVHLAPGKRGRAVCSSIMEDALGFTRLRTWLDSRTRWERAALFCWTVVLAFVSVRVFLSPEVKTVYPIFSSSGRLWWAGDDLYEPYRPSSVQDGYRYSPTFAILMAPFAVMPDYLGGVAWRFASAGALLASLAWLARSVLPIKLTADHFAWLLLLSLPLSLQSVNNGQANVLVIACMIGSVAAAASERWNLASVLMALAFVCKVYPLALGLLLMALYPRQLLLRMPLAIAASLLAPFLCQEPHYVFDQYAKWFALLRADDRSWFPLDQAYRDLWLLVRLYVPNLTLEQRHILRAVYMAAQVSAGGGIAVLCWRRQRSGWLPKPLLTATLGLAVAWMMLLGPATESSSFVLLAPSLAWSLVEALQAPALSARRVFLWLSCALFMAAVFLGGFNNAVKIHALGVHSWASLLYFIYLLTETRGPAGAALEAAPPAAAIRVAA